MKLRFLQSSDAGREAGATSKSPCYRTCTRLYFPSRRNAPYHRRRFYQQQPPTQSQRTHTVCISATVADHRDTRTSTAEVEREAVIGIETHVQLNTATKVFCRCKNEYGAEPNTHICPICMGHPGTLPLVNKEAVAKSILAGLALNCQINQHSKFDRKQYFYPDLPKGYQISQYDEPLCQEGSIRVQLVDGSVRTIAITRAHMEEDAGKLIHSGADQLSGSTGSLVDYNRAGVPLLEIVSEPDMRSGIEAAAYGAELRRIFCFIGVSDGNMAEGSMRCDVNISVRPRGQKALGTKVEIKNMNSFSAIQLAIEYETQRQVDLIRAGRGGEVVQETRLWDESLKCTYSMRKKEGLADYRYFPEPDLPPLVISEAMLSSAQESMTQLPSHKRERYLSLGLPLADVLVLTDELSTSQYFDAVVAAGAPPKPAANWLMGDVMGYCKQQRVGWDQIKLKPAALAEMILLIEGGVISGKIGKQVLPDLLQGKGHDGVKAFIESTGMMQMSDPTEIAAIIDTILAANQKQLEEYRGGKTKLRGYFVGQVMSKSKGRANPAVMNKLLMEKLKG